MPIVRRVVRSSGSKLNRTKGHQQQHQSQSSQSPSTRSKSIDQAPLCLQDVVHLSHILLLALPAGDCVGGICVSDSYKELTSAEERSIGGLTASVVQFLGLTYDENGGEGGDFDGGEGGGDIISPVSRGSRGSTSLSPKSRKLSKPRKPHWIKSESRELCVLVEKDYVVVVVCYPGSHLRSSATNENSSQAQQQTKTRLINAKASSTKTSNVSASHIGDVPRYLVETLVFRTPNLSNVLEHSIKMSRTSAIDKAEGYTVESMLELSDDEHSPERRATDTMMRLLFVKEGWGKAKEG